MNTSELPKMPKKTIPKMKNEGPKIALSPSQGDNSFAFISPYKSKRNEYILMWPLSQRIKHYPSYT